MFRVSFAVNDTGERTSDLFQGTARAITGGINYLYGNEPIGRLDVTYANVDDDKVKVFFVDQASNRIFNELDKATNYFVNSYVERLREKGLAPLDSTINYVETKYEIGTLEESVINYTAEAAAEKFDSVVSVDLAKYDAAAFSVARMTPLVR